MSNNLAFSDRMLAMLSTSLGIQVQEYLNDPGIIEIILNPDGKLWVEKLGQKMIDSGCQLGKEEAERTIRLVASATNTECHETKPSLAAILPGWGARFQGFLPPVVSSPSFSIRKKALFVFTLEDYVKDGVLSRMQADCIKDAVQNRENILVVGGTGTGKTTLSNAILNEISKTGDRILTIEDTPELQCTAPNSLSLYTTPPIYTMQHAVKDALRSRPDRIVVGEVRDGAALDLLKAWNTGHNGGIATIHANGAQEGLTRMEQLIGEVSHHIPRELIAQAVHLLVVIERTASHQRKVSSIARIRGFQNHQYQIEYIS